MSAKTIERIIQRWTRQVLNKPKSWHCVRHTYITLSFESSIPISIVIENTGDKPATILQYYTELSPSFIRDHDLLRVSLWNGAPLITKIASIEELVRTTIDARDLYVAALESEFKSQTKWPQPPSFSKKG